MTTPPMIRPGVAWGHPGHGRAVGAVERPHQPARAGVDTFDHLHVAVALEVTDGRAAHGVPTEVGPPHDVAVRVGAEQGVGVRGPRVERAGAEGDAGLPAGQEVAHRRGRVDRLVGVVVADEVAAGAEDPQVATGRVGHPVGHARRRVAALDHLGLPVAVEVGQGRRGEAAVGGEERPTREERAVARR